MPGGGGALGLVVGSGRIVLRLVVGRLVGWSLLVGGSCYLGEEEEEEEMRERDTTRAREWMGLDALTMGNSYPVSFIQTLDVGSHLRI